MPPLPPGLEVYRPAEVLGSAVLVVEDEAAMQQQLRIDLHDLGYRPAVSSSAPEAMELLARERVAAARLVADAELGERRRVSFGIGRSSQRAGGYRRGALGGRQAAIVSPTKIFVVSTKVVVYGSVQA